MQFNTGTNSIADEARFMAKAASADLPIADIARLANQALDRLSSLVLGVQTTLQFDDPNHAGLPVKTLALSAGVSSYPVTEDDDANAVLEVSGITVADGTSRRVLTRISLSDPEARGYLTGTAGSGTPERYFQAGGRVVLIPAPLTAMTAEVYLSRSPRYFTPDDTTASPGFAAPFHRLVPLWIAYWYCVREGKSTTATQLMSEIQTLEGEFIDYYRDTGGGLRLTPEYADPR